jgi:hypothetical protein
MLMALELDKRLHSIQQQEKPNSNNVTIFSVEGRAGKIFLSSRNNENHCSQFLIEP